MNILAIDSSSKAASCAFMQDKTLVAESFSNAGLTHSQTILPMIDDMLRLLNKSVADVDLIVTTIGPGSFTGLRIGLATAKGLAFAHDISCVGVSTLDTLAYNLVATDGLIIPVMDARRNQVYTAVYDINKAEVKTVLAPTTLLIDQLGAYLNAQNSTNIILVGDGAHMCYDKLSGNVKNIFLAPENLIHQRASSAVLAAFGDNSITEPVSASDLEPEYLRITQAQRELEQKQNS